MISGASRTYDELEVGAVCRSRFGRTVLEADNVWFILLTMIHFDAAYQLRSRTIRSRVVGLVRPRPRVALGDEFRLLHRSKRHDDREVFMPLEVTEP
jgi:hypothetical protein